MDTRWLRRKPKAFGYMASSFILWGSFACGSLGGAHAFATEQRLALVIANSDYQQLRSLPGARRDGQLMADALSKVGFQVSRVNDGNVDGMRRALVDFRQTVMRSPGAIVFVYFAGHGVTYSRRGTVYMLPPDIDSGLSANLTGDALSDDEVFESLQTSGAKLVISVIDACRESLPVPVQVAERSAPPAPASAKDTWFTRSRGLERTLGTRPSALSEMVIMYATDPGNVASDNSLLAQALAEHLQKPGSTVAKVFQAAKDTVATRSERAQVPYLEGDGVFSRIAFVPGPNSEAEPARKLDILLVNRRKAFIDNRDVGAVRGSRSTLTWRIPDGNFEFEQQLDEPWPDQVLQLPPGRWTFSVDADVRADAGHIEGTCRGIIDVSTKAAIFQPHVTLGEHGITKCSLQVTK